MVRNVTETRPVISRRRVLGIAVGSIGAASTVGSLASAAPPATAERSRVSRRRIPLGRNRW